MELSRIQYITHPDEDFNELSWVHRLQENGVNWIQLRLKEEDVVRRFPDKHYLAFFHEIADKMRLITTALGMTFTVNDSLEVAVFSKADGIHIGQDDDSAESIYDRMNASTVLGGTANTLSEIQYFEGVPMTYFGVGPLRVTPTKTKLKPVLGIGGYTTLIQAMKNEGIETPVFAIGGVVPTDVVPLLNAGVYGIAISGAIFHQQHSPEAIQLFTTEIERYELTNRR